MWKIASVSDATVFCAYVSLSWALVISKLLKKKIITEKNVFSIIIKIQIGRGQCSLLDRPKESRMRRGEGGLLLWWSRSRDCEHVYLL